MENGKNENVEAVSLNEDELRVVTGGARVLPSSGLLGASGLKDVLAQFRRTNSDLSSATLLADRIDRRALLNDTLTN